VHQTDQNRKSQPALQWSPEEFPMRSSPVPRHWMGLGWLSGWILTLAVFGLSACATHRGDPPKCKGPFTPINQSSSVVANGPER
jgi:hypothetical protein